MPATSPATGCAPRRCSPLTSTGDVDLHWALPPSHLDVSTDTGDIDVVVPGSRYAVAEKSETGDVALTGVADDSASHRSIRTISDAGDVSIVAPAA